MVNGVLKVSVQWAQTAVQQFKSPLPSQSPPEAALSHSLRVRNCAARRQLLSYLDEELALPFRLHEVIEGWPAPSAKQKRKASEDTEDESASEKHKEGDRPIKRPKTQVVSGKGEMK